MPNFPVNNLLVGGLITRVSPAAATIMAASLLLYTPTVTGSAASSAQTKLQYSAVDVVADFGADPTGVADSSNAIEAAVNSGAMWVTYGVGGTFKITRPINYRTSNVTHFMWSSTLNQATANTNAILVGYNGTGFVKTDNTTFIGGKIVGADNGLTTTVGFGIVIFQPTTVPYAPGAGCSHTKFIDIQVDSFCASFSATGADDVIFDGVLATNMQYHPAASAGGYGILMQTCFGTKINDKCRFIAGSNSRHAIYISADPGRAFGANNVCLDVEIGACLVDWTLATGTTGFETGIYIRGASNVTVIGPTIKAAFGGLTYDSENAAGTNINIKGLIGVGIRAGAGQVAAVGFTRSSGTNRASNVNVEGVVATLANTNCIGVQLAYTDGVVSGGHNINGTSYTYGTFVFNCNNVTLDPSTISGGKNTAVEFGGTCDTVQVSRHVITGTGSAYGYLAQPTNLRFTYPRAFQVSSNGSGAVTVANDEYPVATAVVTDANGFTVTFAPEVLTAAMNMMALSESATIANVYHRTATANTITFGVLGASLTPLPAATNNYTIAFQVMH